MYHCSKPWELRLRLPSHNTPILPRRKYDPLLIQKAKTPHQLPPVRPRQPHHRVRPPPPPLPPPQLPPLVEQMPQHKHLVLLRPHADHGAPLRLGHHARRVPAREHGPHVAHVPDGRGRAVGRVVQRQLLVVRERVDGVRLGGRRAREEAGAVDRAVVEGCNDDVVFVWDEDVAEVDEAVGRAREEEVGGCGVVVELGGGG